MSKNDENNLDESGTSRRKFLKNSGYAVGGIAVGGVLGGLFVGNDEQKDQEDTPKKSFNQALMFFTPDQFAITNAATERIFPKDDNGPGAEELLVPYFIDHQLAGAWGVGATDYTSGPFHEGAPTQGYQGRLTRQQIFAIGLKGLQDYSQKTYEINFADLSAEEQDEVLTDFADGNVELKGITSDHFFGELRGATLEGTYSDPLYGGNAGMAGWEMKDFPGTTMGYIDIIEDEFTEIEPTSLNNI